MSNLERQFANLDLASRPEECQWFPRPTEKCSGDYYCEKVKLLVNWFKFEKNISDREYFEYGVEMKKVRTVKNKRTGKIEHKESEVAILDRPPLFWEHLRQEQSRTNNFNIEEWVFDNKDTVYSVRQEMRPITSVLEKPNNTKYVMRVAIRASFKLYFSRRDPMRDEEVNRCNKFLKVVFTQKVRYSPPEGHQAAIQFTKNYVYEQNSIMRVPESFYDPGSFKHSLEIAPRVEAWLGMYIGVKELNDGHPVLNFAVVNKLFYNMPAMSLLDYLLLVVDSETRHDSVREARKDQIRRERLTISPRKHKQIDKLMFGLKMICTTIWDPVKMRMSERHLTFQRLDERNAEETTFRVTIGRGRDARSTNVPIIEIYRNNRITIHYPKLPLAIVKAGSSEFSVPMELLAIHEKPQRYKNRIDNLMLDKLIKRATIEPHVYKNKTFEMLNELDFNSEELDFVRKFDLCPNLKMIECPGKVLKEPKLVNKKNAPIPMTAVIRGYKEQELNVVPEKELCCAVFVMRKDEDRNPCISRDQAYQFYDHFINGCAFRGMRIGENAESSCARSLLMTPGVDGRPPKYAFYESCTKFTGASNFTSAAHHAKEMFDSLPDKDQKTLLFIVISNYELNAYPFVKYYCDTHMGVPSQHIRDETVFKALDALPTSHRIFYQMALKINAKLNGVNQELEWSENAEISVEEKERRKTAPLTMYVGIDVTHPTTGSGIDYSIASIVASINPGATKYRDMVVTQEEMMPGERPVGRGIETTDILEGKFVKLLRIFAENNDNRVPAHIVVYRDGVSDSEMLRVSYEELTSLQLEVTAFLKERGQEDAPHPKYTYIVVQKRHNTRFIRQMGARPEDKEAAKLWDEELKKGDGSRLSNPHSGTVVDKVVVVDYKFDFYLASHHGAIGTSRPCHYTVMYDNKGLTKDETYKMTYELSFVYARCRKPISLPAPVAYAHLSAEKAKFKYQALKNREITDIPIVKRNEIEAHLQPNPNYPGMSFA